MPISFSATDTGRKRQMNQDFIFSSDIPVGRLPDLYIVADGMGGHRAGEYASEFTANRVVRLIEKSGRSDPAELMRTALTEVNRELRVIARREPEYRGMGTTAVACVITGKVLQAANVGDSRLYTFPSPDDMNSRVHYHYVNGVYDRGGKSTNPEESRAVAAYIRDDLKGVVGDGYESPYGQGRIVAVGEAEKKSTGDP